MIDMRFDVKLASTEPAWDKKRRDAKWGTEKKARLLIVACCYEGGKKNRKGETDLVYWQVKEDKKLYYQEIS
jgi:hypothetical protein